VDDAGALALCNTPGMLDGLRLLILIGMGLIGLALAIDYTAHMTNWKPKPKVVVEEECKLHSRKLKDCPPGSHDEQNSNDSPSQEPPTDTSGASEGQGESALPEDE
jgi:hypothetical protein